ncbi:DUF4249 domain-containing protein [Flavobacterium gilvum]|uniref:DUF4249 domain-containing protein n=1 Tax=Flavobacterium gilvum TaxID=1492737 RepID=A0AAC9N704_9FLAO|nr:DUF4249 domain-containing protein [Flavobacterium gilvum]AOW09673.1 hypothetical protein EM308_09240 [Flavobacterium gilvum]KFC60799.1 hypothetical protein FEM08_04110 [Flavobacterium gilvum]
MNIIKHISIAIALFFFAGCEDVVNVDLNTAPPRLVVDASINWQKGTDGSKQKIILSTTTDYYSNVVPKVSGATVSIKNSQNISYIFAETPNTGEYTCTNFKPVIGETYTLTVNYNGATYTATETMQSVTPIDTIVQNNNAGFSGKDYEIVVYYKDPMAKNFYMVRFFPDINKAPTYHVLGDQFSNGNQKKWNFSDENLKQGSSIDVTHYGISEDYYNYMSKIIATAGSQNPFQTTPATVRGNIVNQTNIDNYALGYFSLSETDFRNYIIQ